MEYNEVLVSAKSFRLKEGDVCESIHKGTGMQII